MTEDSLVPSERKSVAWYDESIYIRGCNLSIENIREFYRDLHSINRSFGEQVIAEMTRNPEMTDEQWDAHKSFLLNDAFRLTITVNGLRDQQMYDESAEIFNNPDLPMPIKSIFFTNANSFRRHSNGNQPRNSVTVLLDFDKPELFDPTPLVSEKTPNQSYVTVNAQDITFFNAVQKAVDKKLTANKTWYGAIHRNFAYDVGMWFIALPVALYFSAFYMDQLIPEDSKFMLFRWPLFVYFIGLSLILYRALAAYAKWAFPVNILKENKDRAWTHRLLLGAFSSWLFYSVASTVYGIVVG